MVWFQCEDCGENLKKPKLLNHFRGCSARKLSCIDCGVVFNQQSVQAHTQCVSEADKYGPKNMGCIKKEPMKTLSKELNCDGLDVSLGLSTRAPWSCSLCNVKATSQETLILHSQGKKHRSKVRSMSSMLSNHNLASKSTPGAMATVSSVSGKNSSDAAQDIITLYSNDGVNEKNLYNPECKNGLLTKEEFGRRDAVTCIQAESIPAATCRSNKEQTDGKKKRKVAVGQDGSPSSATRERKILRNGGEASCVQAGCGKDLDSTLERKQKKGIAGEDVADAWSRAVKWKKIIRRALKIAPNGSLRIKQLCSSVLPLVREVVKESGLEVSEDSFFKELENQIHSHAKFIVDGKNVRLAVTGD